MPPRESELFREWRDSVLENERSLNDRVHKLELEMAVLKVKAALIGILIGMITSAVTTLIGGFLMKALKLS